MPRPRTFDPDDALTAALGVFRAKGYEAASVQDLVDATGLSRSSLYATFGDKHGLFLAALDRYARQGREALDDLCACEGSPLGAIGAFLRQTASEASEGDLPPEGCLMTNVAAEVASRDPDTARRACAARERMTTAFGRLVREAQDQDEIGTGRDPQALARFLTSTVYGLRGLQKAGADPEALADVVETTMAAIAA
ncbi:MAG: TetR/AcrR family transcriptional regulator [Bacteroidota bacterium]